MYNQIGIRGHTSERSRFRRDAVPSGDGPVVVMKIVGSLVVHTWCYNEFAMMWALRETFPLHYVVFKQTACHIPHEANVEQI